jgi:hypothetical protein
MSNAQRSSQRRWLLLRKRSTNLEMTEMIKKILAAIDGSEHAWKALDLAKDLAKLHGARLTVLHVVPYEPMADALRAFAAAENLPFEEEAARFHHARTLGDHLTANTPSSGPADRPKTPRSTERGRLPLIIPVSLPDCAP